LYIALPEKRGHGQSVSKVTLCREKGHLPQQPLKTRGGAYRMGRIIRGNEKTRHQKVDKVPSWIYQLRKKRGGKWLLKNKPRGGGWGTFALGKGKRRKEMEQSLSKGIQGSNLISSRKGAWAGGRDRGGCSPGVLSILRNYSRKGWE